MSQSCRNGKRQKNKLLPQFEFELGVIIILELRCHSHTRVFPAATIPSLDFKAAIASRTYSLPSTFAPKTNAAIPADAEEQLYVQQLRHWAVENLSLPPLSAQAQSLSPTSSLAAPSGKKSKELCEVKEGDYADIVAEVVKVWGGRFGGASTVYVTDYTTNPHFYRYDPIDQAKNYSLDGDDYGYTGDVTGRREWKGPLGKQTAQITLWHPHAQATSSLVEKDIVRMRNVIFRTKRGGYLEGSMHEDRKHPTEIMIRKYRQPEDPKYSRLLLRKDAYWASIEEDPEKGQTNKQRKTKKKREKREREIAERKLREEKKAAATGDGTKEAIGKASSSRPRSNAHGKLRS